MSIGTTTPVNGGESQPADMSFQSAFTDASSAAAAAPPAASPPPPQSPVESQPAAQPFAADASAAAAAQATSPAPASGAASEPDWYASARQLGLDLAQGVSESDAARAMLAQMQQVMPYAQYGQALIPHADQIREFFATQGQAAAAATPEADPAANAFDPDKYFAEQWQAPKWEEQYTFAIQKGLVQTDPDTGLFVASPGYEVMVTPILAGLNQAKQWQSNQWRAITESNPYQHFYSKLQEPIQRLIDERVSQLVGNKLGDFQTVNHIEQFERENSHWLYQNNNGQQALTDKGKAFYTEIKRARHEYGLSDPQAILNLAGRLAGVTFGPAAQQPAAPPPAQGGPAAPAVTQPAAAAQAQPSFLQNALDRASHSAASSGFTTHDPANPAPVAQNELESMFVGAFQASKGTLA